MSTHQSEAVRFFFDHQWHLYQQVIRGDVLCHREMFETLDRFLDDRFGKRPFRFVDFGCGDGSAVLDTLRNRPVSHYTGVDASSDLIATAALKMASLDCQKTLICQDMANAVAGLADPVDLMFCSYSLHHLPLDQKMKFISDCYLRLKTPGYLILVDGVAMEQETRDHWLERLDSRILEKVPDLSDEDRAQIMKHPRESDFPETITMFRRIAGQSPWRSFEVLFERDDFLAFMVFEK